MEYRLENVLLVYLVVIAQDIEGQRFPFESYHEKDFTARWIGLQPQLFELYSDAESLLVGVQVVGALRVARETVRIVRWRDDPAATFGQVDARIAAVRRIPDAVGHLESATDASVVAVRLRMEFDGRLRCWVSAATKLKSRRR